MKSYEEFSASVYEKAETRRQKIRERRGALRNTALCIVAVMMVAALTGTYSRDRAAINSPNGPQQQITNSTENAPRKIGGGDRPQMLVVVKDGGEAKARVLKNLEDQQAFVGQLSPEESDGKASLKQEDTEAKTIHSFAELLDYLKQLPADSLPEMEDYDEAFFAENNLCVMPMDLDTDEAMAGTADGATKPYTEPSAEAILPTIPDDMDEGAGSEDSTSPDGAEPMEENAAAAEPTARPPFPSYEAGDASGSHLLQRFVRAFILLPVSKAMEKAE